jgi:uncharacterized membrane protein
MEFLNLAHVHLILNHLPTIGFGIGVLAFIVGLLTRSESLKKHATVLLFLVAVMAIPTYTSGNAAERVLCPELQCPEGVSVEAIRAHEDMALLAFVLMEATGFFAWLALWRLRRIAALPSWNWGAVLVLSVATMGFMAQAASIGGEIRHEEIRADGAVAPGGDAGESTGIARSIGAVAAGNSGIGWLWPAAEALHFIGLCLLFAVILPVNLRILGVGRGLSYSSLYQLLPLGMLGFVLNLITGMLFFLGAPGQYVNNVEFHRKVVLLVLAGFNVLYFLLVDETWVVGPQDDAPARTKVVAASALFIWIGVLYYGHMLPFLGNAF